MADVGGVGPTAAGMVRGVHGQNLTSVARSLAQDGAGLVDAVGGSTSTHMAEDLQALKRAVWARGDESTPQGKALADTAMHSLFMTAGAILGGPCSSLMSGALEHDLHRLVSNREQLDQFMQQLADFHGTQPGKPEAIYNSLSTAVTSELVKEKVEPKNVPTALFMAGALLEQDQKKGYGPRQSEA